MVVESSTSLNATSQVLKNQNQIQYRKHIILMQFSLPFTACFLFVSLFVLTILYNFNKQSLNILMVVESSTSLNATLQLPKNQNQIKHKKYIIISM